MASASNAALTNCQDPWLADSGTSDHLTANLNNLSVQSQYKGSEQFTVGNGQNLPINHIGNTSLSTKYHNFLLKDVLHVPRLAMNLLSIHKFCLHNNCSCVFYANKLTIQDVPTRRILYKGLSKNGVYPIYPKLFNSISPHSVLLPLHNSITLLHSYTTPLLHLFMYKNHIRSGCYGTIDQVILVTMCLEQHFLLFLLLIFVINLYLLQIIIVSIALVAKCTNYLSINLILFLQNLLNLFTMMYGVQLLLLLSMTIDITLFLLMVSLNFLGCICLSKNLMCLMFLNISKPMLRITSTPLLRS